MKFNLFIQKYQLYADEIRCFKPWGNLGIQDQRGRDARIKLEFPGGKPYSGKLDGLGRVEIPTVATFLFFL